ASCTEGGRSMPGSYGPATPAPRCRTPQCRHPSSVAPQAINARAGLVGERRQALQSAHATAADHRVKLCLIGVELRTIVLRVPQMQHAGRKPAVLAPHAGVEEAHHEVGILQTPTRIAAIESVDMIEIAAGDRKIAGLRA